MKLECFGDKLEKEEGRQQGRRETCLNLFIFRKIIILMIFPLIYNTNTAVDLMPFI
jgi:hypothetical protein